jgi:hypothetical protein
MPKLIQRNSGYGGFFFRDPQINGDGKLQDWAFNTLVNRVIEQRQRNARFGLSTDKTTVENQVDEYNALRCLALGPTVAGQYVTSSGPITVHSPPPSSPGSVRPQPQIASANGAVGRYLSARVEGKKLSAAELIASAGNPKLAIAYIYPLGGSGEWRQKAAAFVQSYLQHEPGLDHDTVIVCNGSPCTDDTRALFSLLPGLKFLEHDNSGWDIGGFQAAARAHPCDLMVFFGATAYFRGPGWLVRMLEARTELGDSLFGATGNQGNLSVKVHPHIRTTAFWCSPKLMNSYPQNVSGQGQGGDRYAAEHGVNCLTNWAFRHKKQPWVVGWTCAAPVQDCDSIPETFHQGTQSNLLVGDRLTGPPYYPHA